MAKRDKDVITLGSGKLYVMLYDAEDGIPEDATIETEENRIGWIKGKISPHYNERTLDFDETVLYNRFRAWGIENNAALEFFDGKPVRTLGSGKVFVLDGSDGVSVKKTEWKAEL